jgi:uncharacterized membrane protein YebE (DUF533 family)
VDNADLLSIFFRGAMGHRGRKRARRAANFLTGNRGFLTASTLLSAAGVAWGVYDSLTAPPPASPATSSVPPSSAASPTVPPIPSLPNDVLRVVRLAVSAARADGTLGPQERALILEHARTAGIESSVEQELNTSRPLAEIVSGVTDAQRKQDLYVLAFTIVRGDETVSGAERIYLAQLAHQLGFDAATTSRLEQQTAASIDEAPDAL